MKPSRYWPIPSSLFRLLVGLSVWLLAQNQGLGKVTFVGNGGNAVDYEITRSMDKIVDFLQIVQAGNSLPCECKESERDFDLCESLKKLNEPQRKQCESSLKQAAPELIRLIQSGQIEYRWSQDDLHVRERHQKAQERPVTAISQPDKNVMMIDQNRFVKLSTERKIALLSHELFHFVKAPDGQFYQDHQAYSAFSGPQGVRQLLNTLGARIALGAWRLEDFLGDRSKAYVHHFIAYRNTALSDPDSLTQNLLANDSRRYTEFQYRYYWGWHGMGVHWGSYDLDASSFVPGANTRLKTNNFGLTYHYRLFPFSPSLDEAWLSSQLHIDLSLGAFLSQGDYEIKDPYTSLRSDWNSRGWIAGANLMLPLYRGFWFIAGIDVRGEQYEIKELSIEDQHTSWGNTFGVSYGF